MTCMSQNLSILNMYVPLWCLNSHACSWNGQSCSTSRNVAMSANRNASNFRPPESKGRWAWPTQMWSLWYCGALGRWKETCYKLVGYPPNWDHSRSNQQIGSGKIIPLIRLHIMQLVVKAISQSPKALFLVFLLSSIVNWWDSFPLPQPFANFAGNNLPSPSCNSIASFVSFFVGSFGD